MEKRRRARINQSLAVLKALIVESSTKSNKSDGSKQKHVKLEKAGEWCTCATENVCKKSKKKSNFQVKKCVLQTAVCLNDTMIKIIVMCILEHHLSSRLIFFSHFHTIHRHP